MRRIKGTRRKGNKLQVYKRVNGTLYTTTMDLDATPDQVRAWQEMKTQLGSAVVGSAESFAARIVDYQTRICAKPTARQMIDHLHLWADRLGRDRDPRGITSAEIDSVLQEWLNAGLAPDTVRKRRTALQSFYKRLFGQRGPNPVRDAYCPPQAKPEARGLDYATIDRILEQMPVYRDSAPGAVVQKSRSRIIVRIMAYTGIPPGLIQQIQPSDLSLTAGTVRIGRRTKGGGVEARTLPLTEDAIAAFRDFHDANLYGNFAVESVNRSFKRACRRAGLNPLRVHLYDLRHSFGTELYRTTGDQATVARLLLHAEGSVITARYTKGAHADVDAAAVQAFHAGVVQRRRAALKVVARRPELVQKVARKVAHNHGD